MWAGRIAVTQKLTKNVFLIPPTQSSGTFSEVRVILKLSQVRIMEDPLLNVCIDDVWELVLLTRNIPLTECNSGTYQQFPFGC